MSASPAITIVGLGPGDPDRRTIEVQRALENATRVFVRVHPGLDLDDLLSRENVTDVARLRQPDAEPGGRWSAATPAVCDAAVDGPVVLAIPGHPRFGEGLVVGTLNEASRRGLTTHVMDGISVVDLMATALDVDPLLQCAQFFNAREVAENVMEDPFAGGLFTGSPLRPMLFTHVYDATIVNGVARALGRILPPAHPVTRIEAAGMAGQHISQHTVGELSSVPGGPLVAFWITAVERLAAGRDPRTIQHLNASGRDPRALQHIGARLRAPGGCPWDRVQTHESLKEALIEEVYEVLDAIDAGHPENLAEELGDVFLHIVMQAQIAEEAGEFTIEDVYEGIAAKIVRRHPHVFANEHAETQADLTRIWKRVKAEEKLSAPDDKPEKDVDGLPRSMPALTRASRILAKHPVATDRRLRSPDERSVELMRAIAVIVQAGDDPEKVLREALSAHVETSSAGLT